MRKVRVILPNNKVLAEKIILCKDNTPISKLVDELEKYGECRIRKKIILFPYNEDNKEENIPLIPRHYAD